MTNRTSFCLSGSLFQLLGAAVAKEEERLSANQTVGGLNEGFSVEVSLGKTMKPTLSSDRDQDKKHCVACNAVKTNTCCKTQD